MAWLVGFSFSEMKVDRDGLCLEDTIFFFSLCLLFLRLEVQVDKDTWIPAAFSLRFLGAALAPVSPGVFGQIERLKFFFPAWKSTNILNTDSLISGFCKTTQSILYDRLL